MRRLLIIVLLLVCCVPARAQFTAVSATVVDPNNNVYQNCSGSMSFVPATTATTKPLINGSTFQTDLPISSCDSFGSFTATLVDNNQVSDGHSGSASQWRFSICSVVFSSINAKICFSTSITITGVSQNISAALKAAAAILPTSGGGGGPPGGVAGDVQTNNGVGGFAGGTQLTSLARTGAGSVYALNLASNAGKTIFADTQSLAGNNACVVTTLTTVTCTTSSFACPGSIYPCSTAGPGSDVGKIAWGGTGSGSFAALAFNTTIASVQSALSLTLSAGISNGTLVVFRYGHDDTPAWDAVNAAYNPLLLNSGACLILPSGISTVKHGTLLVNPTTSYSLGNYPACYISPGLLIFSPTPDFNFTFYQPGVTNIQFVSTAQGTTNLGGPIPSIVTNVGVDGGSLNSGTGVCNMAGHTQEGMFIGQAQTIGLNITGWCPNIAQFAPLTLNNVGSNYNVTCAGSGINCITTAGASDNAPIEIIGGNITSVTGSDCGLLVATAINTSHVTFAGPGIEVCMQGGTWHSNFDNFPQAGGGSPQNGIAFNSTASNAWVDHCFGSTVAGFDWAVLGGANTALHLSHCKFNAGAGNKICNTTLNGGKCFDEGANISIGSNISDFTNSPSITGTPCATGNWALTSGWGASSVTSVTAGGDSHRCQVVITGAAGAANPVLTWTFPLAYFTGAPPASCLISFNGTLTGESTAAPTSTSVAFTFTGTPSAQTYRLDASCGP